MPAGFILTLFRGCGEWIDCALLHGASYVHTCVVAHLGGVSFSFLWPWLCRVSCRGWRYSGWKYRTEKSVLSLDFKSLPSSASPLAPWAPAGEERSWLTCWSQGGDVAELPVACRAPHGLQTSSEEQCCPVTSLQEQPGPVTTDACKETQDAQWVETSLDTLSSELPPWESSASWAKVRLTWANIILPWWGVTPRTRASVWWLSPENQEN